MTEKWTIGHAVSELTAAFDADGLDTPRLDARILVGHAVKLEPSLLFGRAEQILTDEQSVVVRASAARRQRHEPVSRIIGHRGFWGMDFILTPDTLDPRPDTETVVTAVLNLRTATATPRILDLGTGTGCILLAILKDWPQASGIGVDINPGAVSAAAENAKQLGLASRAVFQRGNWADGLSEVFDIVVSNPPYIAATEFPALAPEVTRFDPKLALSGGTDGLAAYRALIPSVRRRLAPKGRLFLEIGVRQAESVAGLLSAGGFGLRAEHRDLGGVVRCLEAIPA